MAFDAFLKIETIDGDSTDRDHRDWIDILSFSWGVTQSGTVGGGGGGGAGKATFEDLAVVTNFGTASPELFEACATGRHFPKAELHVRKAGAGNLDFYKVQFSDIIVSSYEDGGSGDGVADQVSFNFVKVEFES